MTKVFISQPMNGRSDEEILKERMEIFEKYEKTFGDAELIDSFIKTHEEISKGRIYMLGTSIALMHDADVVIFAPKYLTAKGCKIEHMVAKEYKMKVKYYSKVLDRFFNNDLFDSM